jgi:hypothetical protein
MDTTKNVFAAYESVDFRLRSQIINSLAGFTSSVENKSEFQAMIEQYSLEPKTGASVLTNRIEKLLSTSNDTRYLYRYDSAIAAYLYIMHKISPLEYARFSSNTKLPENIWWAGQMAITLDRLISNTKTQYTVNTSEPRPNIVAHWRNVNADNSATSMIQGVFK